EDSMDDDITDLMALQQDLRLALARGEFRLHYQEKRDARSGTVTGLEALIRWQNPRRGLVSPGLFIPIAERFGLIVAIGDWVLAEAARQMGIWLRAGLCMP